MNVKCKHIRPAWQHPGLYSPRCTQHGKNMALSWEIFAEWMRVTARRSGRSCISICRNASSGRLKDSIKGSVDTQAEKDASEDKPFTARKTDILRRTWESPSFSNLRFMQTSVCSCFSHSNHAQRSRPFFSYRLPPPTAPAPLTCSLSVTSRLCFCKPVHVAITREFVDHTSCGGGRRLYCDREHNAKQIAAIENRMLAWCRAVPR